MKDCYPKLTFHPFEAVPGTWLRLGYFSFKIGDTTHRVPCTFSDMDIRKNAERPEQMVALFNSLFENLVNATMDYVRQVRREHDRNNADRLPG